MLDLDIKKNANAQATYDLWKLLEKCIYASLSETRDLTKEEIQEFVKQGADLDAKTEDQGLTAAILAMKEGFAETAKAFIEAGANVNEQDNQGHTVLLLAAANGNVEAIKAFVELGANVNEKNLHGYTACMYAAREGDIEALQLLINLGADLNAVNKWGQTACMEAAYFNKIATVKALAELGVDIYIKDKDGKNVLDMIKAKRIKDDIIETSKNYRLNHPQPQGLKKSVKPLKTSSNQATIKKHSAVATTKKHRSNKIVKPLDLIKKAQILDTDKMVMALRQKRENILKKEIEGIHAEKHRLAVRRRTDVQDLRNQEGKARALKLSQLLRYQRTGK